jgi:uncharacterized protein YgiM (DUF1202 family)
MNRTYFVRASLAAAMMAALALSDAGRAAYANTGVNAVVAQVGEVTVITDTLNVRSGPSTADPIIGRLTCGQRVQPNGKTADGSWWRIPFGNGNGFIFAQFATQGGTCGNPAAAAPAAAAAPVAAAATTGGGVSVRVTSATLNVRSGPGTNYSILGKLNQNQTVTANGKTADGQWLQIDFNGTKAYIFAAYTTFSTGAAPAQAAAPAAAAPAAAAPAPAPAGSFGGFELGAHIKTFEIMTRMKNEAGMSWAKYQAVFSGGAPDLSGVINSAHSQGIKILIGAVGDRGRAGDTNYHKEFAAGLAAIAKQGADAIEVWNEPNLDREYGVSGAGQVNPENYANMLREAYTAIKAANPNVLVVSGAPAPTGFYGGGCSSAGCDDAPFLQRLAAAGGANYADCIGAHHNGTMVGPDTQSGAPVGSASHHGWYFQGTLAVAYNAFGGKRPVCWTELGYVTKDGIAGSLPSGFSWGNNITLANQAEWLARAAQLSRESGKVRIMIIWNADFRQFDDDPQAGFSIFRPDGSCPACGGLKATMGR